MKFGLNVLLGFCEVLQKLVLEAYIFDWHFALKQKTSRFYFMCTQPKHYKYNVCADVPEWRQRHSLTFFFMFTLHKLSIGKGIAIEAV